MQYGNDTPRNGDFAAYVEEIIKHGSDGTAVAAHLAEPGKGHESHAPSMRPAGSARSGLRVMGSLFLAFGSFVALIAITQFDLVDDSEVWILLGATGVVAAGLLSRLLSDFFR